jgi:hypothetical protein
MSPSPDFAETCCPDTSTPPLCAAVALLSALFPPCARARGIRVTWRRPMRVRAARRAGPALARTSSVEERAPVSGSDWNVTSLHVMTSVNGRPVVCCHGETSGWCSESSGPRSEQASPRRPAARDASTPHVRMASRASSRTSAIRQLTELASRGQRRPRSAVRARNRDSPPNTTELRL